MMYRYPSITDPVSLALLEKYDRFYEDDFRTDADGKIRGDEPAAESIASAGYDDMDDADLKALGDMDYDSSEEDFDIDKYAKFLGRIENDDGFKKPDGAEARAKEDGTKDVKGKGEAVVVAVAVDSSSSGDEDDFFNYDEMAREEDLDDDDDGVPFPKQAFRKF